MDPLVRLANALARGEEGASLVEYALLVALIAIAGLVAVTFFGSNLAGSYSNIGSAVKAA